MNTKANFLRTAYLSEEKACTPIRYTSNEDRLKITPIRVTRATTIDKPKFETSLDDPKDFGVNTTMQLHHKRIFSVCSKNPKPTSLKYSSFSPDPAKNFSPKCISLCLDKEIKQQRYPIFPKFAGRAKEKLKLSPCLNCIEITANLPKADGKLIVHKYALPQALVPVRTPSPVTRTPNILEESVLPRPHAIFRKGFTGWKISLKSIYQKHLKKKTNSTS